MKGYIQVTLKTESAEVLEKLLRSFCTDEPDGLFTVEEVGHLMGILLEIKGSIKDRKVRDREIEERQEKAEALERKLEGNDEKQLQPDEDESP